MPTANSLDHDYVRHVLPSEVPEVLTEKYRIENDLPDGPSSNLLAMAIMKSLGVDTTWVRKMTLVIDVNDAVPILTVERLLFKKSEIEKVADAFNSVSAVLQS